MLSNLAMTNITYRPHYQITNGIRYPSFFSPNCFKEALNYVPKPGDVFIDTYPKCGTTWMQCIALHIFRKGRELENHKDFYKMSPFIDSVGNQGIDLMPRPGAFKTHLPYTHVHYSPDAKYIIVLRNPKDCCVSLFYHTKMNLGFGYWEAEFDDFFELFMAGEVEYNDYFDHVMSWYPHHKNSNVFFTTYENMKKDTKDIVHKLAKFLGQEYIEAIEKDNNVLNNILNFSSFEYMKKCISSVHNTTIESEEELNDPGMLEGTKYKVRYRLSLNPPSKEKLQFVRKGTVGDWRNHLSEEQSERLSKKFFERTKGTEIYEIYKNYI